MKSIQQRLSLLEQRVGISCRNLKESTKIENLVIDFFKRRGYKVVSKNRNNMSVLITTGASLETYKILKNLCLEFNEMYNTYCIEVGKGFSPYDNFDIDNMLKGTYNISIV